MDRISELSDELLIKILSFLPTKLAVSTSILSKRWENLWMWLPKLRFDSTLCLKSQWKSLVCFLDRNLPLHRAPFLESFRFEFSNPHVDPVNIKLWIVIAVSLRVRELWIYRYSRSGKLNMLPSNLYTCKSLVTLKLDGRILLDVPRMSFLPSLETLELRHTGFYNDASLPRLLSNCPVLEDLSVEFGKDPYVGKLTIVSPSLSRLSLRLPCLDDITGIVIETPSLTYLKLEAYNNSTMNQYCLVENMPNLMTACLDVALPDIKSLMRSITSVFGLSICSQVMLVESCVFRQLEYLLVCRGTDHSSDLLVRLLKDSPNLKELDLLVCKHGGDAFVHWNEPSSVPECVLSSLQSVNWLGYCGRPEERDLAVYFLEKALRLKTITIKYWESDVSKFEMLKELALAPRASPTCKLIFEHE